MVTNQWVAGFPSIKSNIRMVEAVGCTNVSVTSVFFDKEDVDSALDELKDSVNLKSIPRKDVYKAAYVAKITVYKPV